MSDQDEGGGGGGGVSTAGFYLLNTDIIISFIKPLGLIVCSQFIVYTVYTGLFSNTDL